jgi:ubiquinone/menaquinone biosynthesis C-methylase UbiE
MVKSNFDKLNIGCGKDIKKGFLNLDMQQAECVDVVHNLEDFPYPFDDNTFSYVYAESILEHLSDVTRVLDELHRICKPDAIIEIKVPWYNFKGMYNDVTHKTFFNHRSFHLLTDTKKHSYKINPDKKFDLIYEAYIPSAFGLWTLIFPTIIRIYIATILGSMIKTIHVKLKVIKR